MILANILLITFKRPTLFRILKEKGLDLKTEKIIEQTLTDTKAKINFKGKLSKLFWLRIRELGGKKESYSGNISSNHWLSYFTKHLGKEEKEKLPGFGLAFLNNPNSLIYDEELEATLTVMETAAAIRSMKNGKTSELDGLPIEFYKFISLFEVNKDILLWASFAYYFLIFLIFIFWGRVYILIFK